MNRALIRRLINEYLDGEIGLADKAELERLMAEDPQVRAEYKALRQIGLQLAQLPEIVPHPQRFRGKVQDALDAQARPYFTAQRVFAGAMSVALVVIMVSFGMLVFQEGMLGRPIPPAPAIQVREGAPLPDRSESVAVLDTWVDADVYFSRLLVENQLGMVNSDVLTTVAAQTNIMEGAKCDTSALNAVKLAFPVRVLQFRATPSTAQQLSKIAEEVAGRDCPITVRVNGGQTVPFEQYLRASGGPQTITLLMRFK